MLWFASVFLTGVMFYAIGVTVLRLHLVGSSIFALFSSATVIYGCHYIARFRRIPGRIQRAISGGAEVRDVRSLVYEVFGMDINPCEIGIRQSRIVGALAVVPSAIVLWALIPLSFPTILVVLPGSIVMAVVLGFCVFRLASPKTMLSKAEAIIAEWNTDEWGQIIRTWNVTREARRDAAVVDAQTAAVRVKTLEECRRIIADAERQGMDLSTYKILLSTADERGDQGVIDAVLIRLKETIFIR